MKIEICMGSSCFSRGNPEHLRMIRDYITRRGLSAEVCIIGHLCEDQCSEGPNICIDGHMYHRVTPAALQAALDEAFRPMQSGAKA